MTFFLKFQLCYFPFASYQETGRGDYEGVAEGLLINLSSEKWGNYCGEIGNIRSCLSTCLHPDDNSSLQIAQACLDLASTILCNTDIQESIDCLTEISNQPSETCKLKCNHHKQAFVKTYKAFTQSRPISPDDPDKAIEGVCRYYAGGTDDPIISMLDHPPFVNFDKLIGLINGRLINCRLFCRKEEIIQQCQPVGFEAAKALARAFGQFLQRFNDHSSHDQIVGPLTISGHCTADKLVEQPA